MTVLNTQATHDANNGDTTWIHATALQALPQADDASNSRFPSIDAILHDLDATFDTQRLAA